MKRLIAFLLALTMLFALAACSAKNENTDADAPSSTLEKMQRPRLSVPKGYSAEGFNNAAERFVS